jgi:hypothetical protein
VSTPRQDRATLIFLAVWIVGSVVLGVIRKGFHATLVSVTATAVILVVFFGALALVKRIFR